jgi:hypothetical protein
MALILEAGLILTPSMALAVTPIGTNNQPHTKIAFVGNQPEGLTSYLSANCGIQSVQSSYVSCKIANTDAYLAQLKQIQDSQTADKNSEFQRRMLACSGNKGSIGLDFGKMITALRCTVQVAFIPHGEALKNTFKSINASIMTHQPVSYIPVGITFLSTMVHQFAGGVSCGVSGLYRASLTFPHQSSPTVITFPCKPNSAMGVIRTLAGILVWFEFSLWIFRKGMSFLNYGNSFEQPSLFE